MTSGSHIPIIEVHPVEDDVVRAARQGDRDAFRSLVIQYQSLVYGLVYRHLGDSALAEDLTQEIFLKAHRGLSGFRAESKFSSWLTALAINHLRNHFKSRAHQDQRSTTPVELPTLEEFDFGPEADLLQREELRRFQCAIQALPVALREVLVLCGVEGRSYSEVSEVLGIPVGTVRSRLHAARTELRALISSLFQGGCQ
jgi:RNA polymerase sigma-70 factor (ECF subfamily)